MENYAYLQKVLGNLHEGIPKYSGFRICGWKKHDNLERLKLLSFSQIKNIGVSLKLTTYEMMFHTFQKRQKQPQIEPVIYQVDGCSMDQPFEISCKAYTLTFQQISSAAKPFTKHALIGFKVYAQYTKTPYFYSSLILCQV